jgi:hypothetical protein
MHSADGLTVYAIDPTNQSGAVTVIGSLAQELSVGSPTLLPHSALSLDGSLLFMQGWLATTNCTLYDCSMYIIAYSIPAGRIVAAYTTSVFGLPAAGTSALYVLAFNGLYTFPLPAAPSGGSVLGDPSFVGLRGQTFQVHGMDGAVYSLLSSQCLQLNALFSFLDQGRCPLLPTGLHDTNCWSHPGSYLGAIGLRVTVESGAAHLLRLTAGPHDVGFSAVKLDSATLPVGSTFTDGTFSVSHTGSHAVEVQTAQFALWFSNSDRFVNQQLAVRVPMSELSGTHGLLGQTHSRRVYSNALRYVEGDVDDYTVADNDLFGYASLYNRFEKTQA